MGKAGFLYIYAARLLAKKNEDLGQISQIVVGSALSGCIICVVVWFNVFLMGLFYLEKAKYELLHWTSPFDGSSLSLGKKANTIPCNFLHKFNFRFHFNSIELFMVGRLILSSKGYSLFNFAL